MAIYSYGIYSCAQSSELFLLYGLTYLIGILLGVVDFLVTIMHIQKQLSYHISMKVICLYKQFWKGVNQINYSIYKYKRTHHKPFSKKMSLYPFSERRFDWHCIIALRPSVYELQFSPWCKLNQHHKSASASPHCMQIKMSKEQGKCHTSAKLK